MSKIELIHGDCLVEMQHIPDKSVDMVLCDLPYGTTACKWDTIIPFEPLWEQYQRIAKPNAAIVLFCIEPFTSALVMSNVKEFREKLTWEKHKPSNIGNAKYMHLKYSEDIIVFAHKKSTYNPQMQPRTSDRVRQAQKGNSKQWRTNRKETGEVSFATQYQPRDWKSFDADWKYPSNIIKIPAVVSNSKEKCDHPTQKPVALLEYLIKTYSNEGDTILDNTMGSGSTMVACVNTKRNGIGIELDDNYFKIAQERVKQAQTQITLFKVMEFHIKEGWQLNPNEKVVKAIVKGIERCGGECPCANTSEDKRCPCSNYLQHDHCCCKLYIKKG